MGRPGLLGAALLWSTLAPSASAQAQVNVEAVSVEAAAVAVAGDAIAFVATVRIDPGTTVSLTPYLTSGGVLAGATALSPIPVPQPAVGRTVRIETTAAVPAGTSGVFTFAVVLDAADAIAESNELDNAAIAPATTRIRAQRAEPRVSSMHPAVTRARPGDPVLIDLTVHNAGELAATVDVSANLSRGATVSPVDPELGRVSVTVAPGETVVRALAGVVPADLRPEHYTLAAIVDPDGLVDEVHETDNVFAASAPFVVFEDTLAFVTATLPEGTVTLPYHVALQASGGDGRYAYQVVQGNLPDGLSLSAAGVLSGTPTRSDSFDFTVQVDSDGKQDTQAFSVAIARSNAPLTIATREAADGFLNMPYEQTLVAGGGEAPYVWRFVGGALPPGLSLSSEGVIGGVPSALGTFAFSVTVEDALGGEDSAELAILVTSAANVIVLSASLDPFPVGEPVSVDLRATGGTEPYEWVALSPPPPGLEITPDGRLVGTPTQVGRWAVYVSVRDSSVGEVRDTATIQVVVEDAGDFAIEVEELPHGKVRQNFEVVLTARGGQPPLHWSVATGSYLPADFYLVDGDGESAPLNAGLLYGFPIFDGVHAFTLRVEDAFGRRREMIYSLTVDTPQIDLGGGCHAAGDSAGFAGLLLLGGLAGLRRQRSGRSCATPGSPPHSRGSPRLRS